MDNKNIKTTDWLVKGISKKRLKKEKIQALKKEIKYLEAELKVCNEALDNSMKLNNHLQAENERLEHQLETLCLTLKLAKTEAYKECIEKVKEEIKQALESNYKARAERENKDINLYLDDLFWNYCSGKIDCLRGLDDFCDNLLKINWWVKINEINNLLY